MMVPDRIATGALPPDGRHVAPSHRKGSIEALYAFLDLSTQNDFMLVVAWLLAALRPGDPYRLLAISGEQGWAKTALSKLFRALADPNVAAVRARNVS